MKDPYIPYYDPLDPDNPYDENYNPDTIWDQYLEECDRRRDDQD